MFRLDTCYLPYVKLAIYRIFLLNTCHVPYVIIIIIIKIKMLMSATVIVLHI
jgi:hypothetical protein